MLYLSRLILNNTHLAISWSANLYHVHQRLCTACEGDPRVLFRMEENGQRTQILVQTHQLPNWDKAFHGFKALQQEPECKPFELDLVEGAFYRFRMRANPTVRRRGERLGLWHEDKQLAWLRRKLQASGACLVDCLIVPQGLQYSRKAAGETVTHLSVQFNGLLQVQDPGLLTEAVASGIGSAKGFGFGLLSLAPARG